MLIPIGIHMRLCSSNQYCNRVGNCSVQCMNWTRNPATTVCICMYAWYVCLVCMPGMYAWYICLVYMYAWFVCLVCMPGMYAWYVCLVYTPGTGAEITSVCGSLASLWSALNSLIATNCVNNRSYFAGGENVYPVGLHN